VRFELPEREGLVERDEGRHYTHRHMLVSRLTSLIR
jgi:hypothetical protein